MAETDRNVSKPIFVSTLAATGMNKLRLMLSEDAILLRTQIHVPTIRNYLLKTGNAVPKKAVHPAYLMGSGHFPATVKDGENR